MWAADLRLIRDAPNFMHVCICLLMGQTTLLYTGRSLSTNSKVVTATSISPKGILEIKSITNCKCYSKCINSFEITCIMDHNLQVRENGCGKTVILKHLSCRAIYSLHFDISGILDCAGCSSHSQKMRSDPKGEILYYIPSFNSPSPIARLWKPRKRVWWKLEISQPSTMRLNAPDI